jgi:uncharacterized membrane protein YoaK (UPF0700 family)
MTSNPQSRSYSHRMDLVILLLAGAGSSLDTVLILSFNVLTGAQTGNTVLLGAAIALGRLAAAFDSLISVVCYVIGASIGEFLIVKHRSTWLPRSAVSTVLIAELITLNALFVLWHIYGQHPSPKVTSVLIACAATAMGMQSAAMLGIGKVPTTTYITGTLTTFATNLVRWLDSSADRPVSLRELHLKLTDRCSSVGDSWIYGLTWFAYLAASILTGLLFLHISELALLLPVSLVVLIILLSRHDAEPLNKNPENGTINQAKFVRAQSDRIVS